MNKNNNLKKIIDLFKNGKFTEALVLCDQFQDNQNGHIIKNLKGAIYFKQKNYELAKKNFFQSIELNKNFIDPYNNLYPLLVSIKDYKNLVIIAKKILELDKNNPISHFKLAYAYEISGNLSQSINFYNTAINLGFADKKIIYNNLGNIYLQLDKLEKSIEYLTLSFEESRDNKFIINNLIRALIKKRDVVEADKFLKIAEEIDKDFVEYLYNKAEFLVLSKKLNNAINILKTLINVKKDSKFFLLLSKIYFTLGDELNGKKIIKDIFLLFPNDHKVLNFKGMRELYEGNFEDGWKYYEFRRSALNNLYPNINKWKGETLKDKRILVYNEQGIGDCIQFSKYLFPLSKVCKNIDFLVNEKISNMFRKDIKEIKICTKKDINLNQYDFKIPLGSLLKFFYKEINNYNETLINIDKNVSEKFNKQIDKSKLNIGIVWSGSLYGPREPYSSIPLSMIGKILDLNANFYSLQNEIRKNDEVFFNKSNLIKYGHLSFSEIPSFMKNLDLIISTDTSFLHLAGSINKETWGLLPLNTDWRWGKFYNLDPYNNTKIYKQKNFDNWDEVLSLIEVNLKKKIDLFKSN